MPRLTVDDILFVLQEVHVPAELKRRRSALPVPADHLKIDEIDRLRDLVGERLQETGFGSDYVPTEVGRRLDNLVDKLFAG